MKVLEMSRNPHSFVRSFAVFTVAVMMLSTVMFAVCMQDDVDGGRFPIQCRRIGIGVHCRCLGLSRLLSA